MDRPLPIVLVLLAAVAGGCAPGTTRDTEVSLPPPGTPIDLEPGDVPRISVEEARGRVVRGEALFVCAYPDEARWQRSRLEGAIPLPELNRRLPELDPGAEIILYCA